jgi:phage terminase large subunit GpA-like protein
MGSPNLPLPSLPPWLQEKLPSAWQLDCEVFAAAIRPDPKLTVDEWADQKRILTPDSSKEPGQWRTDRVPHARAIMRSLSPSDPCTEVTLVAGTQVAKTEIGNNFVGFVIDVSPAPMMMTLPTSNVAKRNSKTRLAKMIDAMPCLREKISENSRDSANSATLKQFPGGVLVIAGANSAAELKSQPVRFLFEDEVDEYPDDVDGQGPADELAEKRTDTYRRNKKIYRASTPRGRYAKSKIWKHWLRSNMQRRHVPCPHCNELQVLRWEGFRYDTRKIWTVTLADSGEIVEVPEGTADAKVRDTGEVLDAWYECEHCARASTSTTSSGCSTTRARSGSPSGRTSRRARATTCRRSTRRSAGSRGKRSSRSGCRRRRIRPRRCSRCGTTRSPPSRTRTPANRCRTSSCASARSRPRSRTASARCRAAACSSPARSTFSTSASR